MPRESKDRCLELGHQPKSPRKAIREYCIECCNGLYNEVELCCSTHCTLYEFRMGKSVKGERRQSAEEIKKHCLSCVETYSDVVGCKLYNCKLWPFRLGKSPWREKVMTEEQKKKFLERIGKKAVSTESAPVGLVKEN